MINLHHEIYQSGILFILQQLFGHINIASSFEVELQTGNGPAFDNGLGETSSFSEILLALHQVYCFILLNFVVEGLEQRQHGKSIKFYQDPHYFEQSSINVHLVDSLDQLAYLLLTGVKLGIPESFALNYLFHL